VSLPLDKNKYSSEPFFNPSDFIGYIRRLDRLGDRPAPEAVILCYQRSLFDYASNEVDSSPAGAYFGKQLRYLEETEGKVAIVGNFGVGAPAAVVMLEELIAFGVRRFVSVGTAGSLVLDLPPGSLLLCDGAFRDEGCSYHYLPEAELAAPDPGLTEKLGAALAERNLAFRRGPAWTTDAIYRETKDEVEFFRKKGRPRGRDGGRGPLQRGGLPQGPAGLLLQRERHPRGARLAPRVPRRDHEGRPQADLRGGRRRLGRLARNRRQVYIG